MQVKRQTLNCLMYKKFKYARLGNAMFHIVLYCWIIWLRWNLFGHFYTLKATVCVCIKTNHISNLIKSNLCKIVTCKVRTNCRTSGVYRVDINVVEFKTKN